MTQLNRSILGTLLALGLVMAGVSAASAQDTEEETYSENEILEKAKGFFGMTTEGLAKAIEKVFGDLAPRTTTGAPDIRTLRPGTRTSPGARPCRRPCPRRRPSVPSLKFLVRNFSVNGPLTY